MFVVTHRFSLPKLLKIGFENDFALHVVLVGWPGDGHVMPVPAYTIEGVSQALVTALENGERFTLFDMVTTYWTYLSRLDWGTFRLQAVRLQSQDVSIEHQLEPQ